MWSLGVVLYILLSGLPPFWGDNEEEIFKMILRAELDLSSEAWTSISEPAKDLLRKLLQRNPARRATPKEVLPPPPSTHAHTHSMGCQITARLCICPLLMYIRPRAPGHV